MLAGINREQHKKELDYWEDYFYRFGKLKRHLGKGNSHQNSINRFPCSRQGFEMTNPTGVMPPFESEREDSDPSLPFKSGWYGFSDFGRGQAIGWNTSQPVVKEVKQLTRQGTGKDGQLSMKVPVRPCITHITSPIEWGPHSLPRYFFGCINIGNNVLHL